MSEKILKRALKLLINRIIEASENREVLECPHDHLDWEKLGLGSRAIPCPFDSENHDRLENPKITDCKNCWMRYYIQKATEEVKDER